MCQEKINLTDTEIRDSGYVVLTQSEFKICQLALVVVVTVAMFFAVRGFRQYLSTIKTYEQ